MRDFPIFTTQNGVGSLILKEVPYRETAYIHIQDAREPEAFLKECVDFCRMAGAKKIYAKGHDILKTYPVHTAVWQMQADRLSVADTDAALFPVTEKTAERWRTLYNEKMRNIPNGAYLSFMDMKRIVQEGGAYFVHRNGQLLGIGMASEGKLHAVASVCPGGGKHVVAALCQTLGGDLITLEVASVNAKALTLYEALGFTKSREVSVWHQVSTLEK